MAFRLSSVSKVEAPKVQLPDGEHRVIISFGTYTDKTGERYDSIELCPVENGYFNQRIVLNSEKTFGIVSSNISDQLGLGEMDIQEWIDAVTGKEISCWIVTTPADETGKQYHNAYLYKVATNPVEDGLEMI